jgi:hypothetical protein
MPIAVTPVQVSGIRGFVWKICDEHELARLIARVYLGHARHVENILRRLRPSGSSPPVSVSAAKSAKKLLAINTDHRDGLLFQAISWIVAQREASKGSIIKLPHLIPAHKGFDGLQIDFGAKQKMLGLVIFEDKATKNSRSTITNKVWPEFKKIEAGARENELMHETTALLERASGVDVDKVIEEIVWQHLRRYRVSVTGEAAHDSITGFKGLFDGYDKVAPGDDVKRRAAVLCFKDVLLWMAAFANKVEKAIDKEKDNV